MTAEITPRTSGELFLFVNDAVLGVARIGGAWFYRNNAGTARITVALAVRRDGSRPHGGRGRAVKPRALARRAGSEGP